VERGERTSGNQKRKKKKLLGILLYCEEINLNQSRRKKGLRKKKRVWIKIGLRNVYSSGKGDEKEGGEIEKNEICSGGIKKKNVLKAAGVRKKGARKITSKEQTWRKEGILRFKGGGIVINKKGGKALLPKNKPGKGKTASILEQIKKGKWELF